MGQTSYLGAPNTRTSSAPGRRPVTRANVGQLAGVSPAAVSCVVCTCPRRIAPVTAECVRGGISLLDYPQNACSRTLRRGRTETIGLILGENLNSCLTEYTLELVRGAAEHGQALLIGEARYGGGDQADIAGQRIWSQVDSLLLESRYLRIERVKSVHSADIPSRLIDLRDPAPELSQHRKRTDGGRVPRVDALVGRARIWRPSARSASQETGLGFPDDVAIVSLNGTQDAEFRLPPLTVAKQDSSRPADGHVALLDEPLPSPGRHVQIPTTLVTRASCGCPGT